MVVGRLLERTEAAHIKFAHLERRVSKLERKKDDPSEAIGALEKLIKSWATWLIPLIVAWLTGSLEAALKVAGLFK